MYAHRWILVVVMVVLGISLVCSIFWHREPAPGFAILTDGTCYTYRWPSGSLNIWRTYYSKQEAINSTWRQYEIQKEEDAAKARTWKEIK